VPLNGDVLNETDLRNALSAAMEHPAESSG
jgi:hypothetical protein